MKWRGYMVSGPAAFVAGWILLWLRHRSFGFESLGNLAQAGAMLLQFVGYRQMLAQDQPAGLTSGLDWAQTGWFLFALSLPGQGPALGSAGFLVSMLLIKAPLRQLLSLSGFRHRFLILFGFLALVGCLPFSSFSAYFQTFIPMMAVGDAMTQKLSNGVGFWAAIVLVSVVYQSCALGYFYWSRVLPDDGGKSWGPEAWVCGAGLLFSLYLGIFRNGYGALLRAGLTLAGIEIN